MIKINNIKIFINIMKMNNLIKINNNKKYKKFKMI